MAGHGVAFGLQMGRGVRDWRIGGLENWSNGVMPTCQSLLVCGFFFSNFRHFSLRPVGPTARRGTLAHFRHLSRFRYVVSFR